MLGKTFIFGGGAGIYVFVTIFGIFEICNETKKKIEMKKKI
jgi:hypothetical protein